jgi:starch synthase (maltosyl-transferring)
LRIYRLHRPIDPAGTSGATRLSVLETQLQGSAALGFSHVLFAAPLSTDWYRSECDDELRQLTTLCTRHQLVLLLDLRLDGPPPGTPHATDMQQPDGTSAEPPTASGEQLEQAWSQRLREMVALGVGGFRCVLPLSLSMPSWTRIIASVRASQASVRFAAWTPGLTPAQLRALAPCGFDIVFSSLPWWDFIGGWLVDEHQNLRALQAKIINPVVGEIAGADPAQDTLVQAAVPLSAALAQRQVLTAVASGDGWLMPADFIEPGLDQDDTDASQAAPRHPLNEYVTGCNTWLATASSSLTPAEELSASVAVRPVVADTLRTLSSPGAALTLLARTTPVAHVGTSPAPLVLAINPDPHRAASMRVDRILTGLALPEGAGALVADAAELSANEMPSEPGLTHSYSPLDTLELAPAQVRLFRAGTGPLPTVAKAKRGKTVERRALETAFHLPRISIEAIQPQCDGGRFAVRRVVGERVTVEADVWMDGHDTLAVALCWRVAGAGAWQEIRMEALGNDRWRAAFPLQRLGRHEFTVRAWRDSFATWLDEIEKKRAAGLDLTLEIEEGSRLLRKIADHAAQHEPEEAGDEPWRHALTTQSRTLGRHGKVKEQEPAAAEADTARLQILLDPKTRIAVNASGYRPFLNQSALVYPLEADRVAARFSSWYELFPRSQTENAARHGTFDDVIERLPAISAMGFDVLYFPPIHPIGKKHRKGRNNSLEAQPGEPGSPYAIGSEHGGHDTIHPQLGTLADFRRLRDAAAGHGLELALDFAIQCAPDHPWLRDHPEWFSYRPDGTVRYAENPPKKYQDIVNVDFYAGAAPTDLWQTLRDVVLFWADQGIRIFRVDNPHTKPFPFWEWLIAEVRSRYPGTLFLAEAFTRPKPMARLAKLGFTQSYTYFTWRNNKAELSEYMTQLTQSELRDYFRPHFFVNTPDINPYFLHGSGRPGFLIRAALAALLSGLWGMVSGFELCEAEPLVVGEQVKEEYLDSEKFQIRPRDIATYASQPNNIVAEITRLNTIRRNYPALQNHLGVRFYQAGNPQILYFARYLEADPPVEGQPRFSAGVVLVAISLDPFHVQEADIDVPLWEWYLPDNATLQVDDLMLGQSYSWTGRTQHIRLDPQHNPFAVWHVRPAAAASGSSV